MHDKTQCMDKIYFIFNAHMFKQVHGFISKRNGLMVCIISSCKSMTGSRKLTKIFCLVNSGENIKG